VLYISSFFTPYLPSLFSFLVYLIKLNWLCWDFSVSRKKKQQHQHPQLALLLPFTKSHIHKIPIRVCLPAHPFKNTHFLEVIMRRVDNLWYPLISFGLAHLASLGATRWSAYTAARLRKIDFVMTLHLIQTRTAISSIITGTFSGDNSSVAEREVPCYSPRSSGSRLCSWLLLVLTHSVTGRTQSSYWKNNSHHTSCSQ